jgi:hypothetical protein
MEQEVLEAALGRVGGIVGMVRKMEKISLTCGLHCHWMICQNHLPGWFGLEGIWSGFDISMVQGV